MSREAGQAHLDTYLAQVRRHLRGLSEAEADETIAELRAHVLDRVDGDLTPNKVEAAIAALGSPRDVAVLNVTERVAATMETRRTPLGVVAAVGRLAGLSVMGFVSFMVSLTGYGMAAGFLATALWKPFDPGRVGMWVTPKSEGGFNFSMGIIDDPAGHELLGWWVIPVSLALALAFAYLTWRFGAASVRAMARRAKRR
ncbi:MAG: hypothetical protein ABW360_18195 [Phenylobacterium sp.]